MTSISSIPVLCAAVIAGAGAQPSGQSGLWQTLATVGLLAGGLLVVLALRRSGVRRHVGAPTADQGSPDDVIRDSAELAERLAAELDGKADRIEGLLSRAEDVILRLEGLERSRARVETEGALVEPKAAGFGIDPVHRRVYDMADAGRSVLEIAGEVGQPSGQVELILNLRRI